MMLTLIWCLTVLAALVLFIRQRYSRFRSSHVNHLPPIPPVGNMGWTILRREHLTTSFTKVYEAFPEDRFVGYYEFLNPVVVLKDPDLIKQIALKDFDYFVDHRVLIDTKIDPLFGRNLFSLKGSEWRDMRSTLSPAFTSSKIKLMVPFMTEVGNEMNKVLAAKIKASKDKHLILDTRDLTTRYANDVVASCAFGLKVNSHTDVNNEFYTKGKECSNFDFIMSLKFFGLSICPRIMGFFKITLFTDRVQNYFRSLVSSVMATRQEQNIVRPDMIHLLMEAKKGKLTHDEKATVEDAGFATVEESNVGLKKVTRAWSDDDLVAQAILFLLGGFDTVSTIMTFLLNELALHPEIQDRLAKEIRDTDTKNGGKFDFNSIQQMTYMDMVVCETLRLWSPGAFLDRICEKDYNLGKANSKSTKDHIIRKGEGVWIPVWALQRDPQYFPDPKRFDPERFSDENKGNIHPFAYIPFGIGPRNCIGSRFALCEVKVMAYQLLKVFEVSPCEKTRTPTELETDTFSMRIKGGAWLRYSIRK